MLARWLSYQIVTSRAIIFTHPEYFRSCFPSQLSGGLHFRIFLRSKFSNPFSDYSIFMPFRSSPYSSGASFKYASISSRSLLSIASWFPQVYSCFSYFPGESFSFVIQFWIPTVARSRFFLLLSYQLIRSFQILPVVHEDFLKFCAISPLNLSNENK